MSERIMKVSRDAARMIHYQPKQYEFLLLLEAALYRRGFMLAW